MKKQWVYVNRFNDANDGRLTEKEKRGGEETLPTVEVTRRFRANTAGCWPRLVISIETNTKWMQKTQGVNFLVIVNRKNDITKWWTQSHVPCELLPDLVEMLTEFKKLVAQTDKQTQATPELSPG